MLKVVVAWPRTIIAPAAGEAMAKWTLAEALKSYAR
jgi:hypothetical protein